MPLKFIISKHQEHIAFETYKLQLGTHSFKASWTNVENTNAWALKIEI